MLMVNSVIDCIKALMNVKKIEWVIRVRATEMGLNISFMQVTDRKLGLSQKTECKLHILTYKYRYT